MMKTMMAFAAALTLTACMDGNGAEVSRISTSGSSTCPGVPHMNTTVGLPTRCGPQAELPYTLR